MTEVFHIEDGGTLSPATRRKLAERIKADIDEFCRVKYDDGARSHLGASVIGDPCKRRLWFSFRWAKRELFDGRMQRLFNRGHKTEQRFIEWLRGIGFQVEEVDPNTGKQFRIYAVQGHFGGSSDGRGLPPYLPMRFLTEFKTYNTRRFAELIKDKSVAKTKQVHFAQMSMYGAKQNFRYGIYFAINKNDDDIYVEVVELDWRLAQEMETKAADIIYSKTPPERISQSPAFHECYYCAMKGICFHNEPVDKNCRSCAYAIAVDNGEWFCTRFNGNIPKEFIPNGCNQHQSIPTC